MTCELRIMTDINMPITFALHAGLTTFDKESERQHALHFHPFLLRYCLPPFERGLVSVFSVRLSDHVPLSTKEFTTTFDAHPHHDAA